ncbi:MAG: hypothetical protein K5989_03130 [Lachnospiraceae bacterium]|nr:hypothetical protein [Lachnospiraceae bacterium]
MICEGGAETAIKVAVICEGGAETAIMEMLLDADRLIFTENALFYGGS